MMGALLIRLAATTVARHIPFGHPVRWKRVPVTSFRLKGARRVRFMHELAERDGRCCFYCRTVVEDVTELTIDHFLARRWAQLIFWKGCHAPWNLVLACARCNDLKDSHLPWPLLWAVLAAAQPRAQALAA